LLYNLENLTWQEFEGLSSFYLKKLIGAGLIIFDGSQDMGRDAAFSGTANEYPSHSAPYSGDWIFQVKHRITKSRTIAQVEKELLRTLSGELEKIFKKHNFLCNNYLYITNLNVSNLFRDRANLVFSEFCQKNAIDNCYFGVLEYKDFEVFLSNNPHARYAFPSLLAFTDLENIFLRKEEFKNKGYIKYAREEIKRFVSTNHYLEAYKRILDYNFLMLVGNPKSGKTSIVEALALVFLENSDYKPYFIHNTDEFFNVLAYLSPNEGALFICDDIFGKHELDQSKLQEWTDYFQSVMGLVETNRKFIFTTCQYIYEEFANKSGLRALFPNVDDPTRYLVKLSKLSEEEREQILEKHLLMSNLPKEKIELVNILKADILACKDFSPEVVRSLVSLVAKTEPGNIPEEVSQHIQYPNQYLYEFFNNIHVQKRLLLLALAVTITPDLADLEKTFVRLLDDANEKPQIMFNMFIDEIVGSIVKKREYLDTVEIEYYHPSMFDVIIDISKQDSYYRNLLLRNLNLELLFLFSFREVKKESLKIRIISDEITALFEGLERYLLSENVLANVTRVLKWINIISAEIPYSPHLIKPFGQLRKTISQEIAKIEFFERHESVSVIDWINLLDSWSILLSDSLILYSNQLETTHRDYDSYDYWRLVFLLEGTQREFIIETIDKSYIERFASVLTKKVNGLRLGLNITQGKPKTYEKWYPLYLEIDDLVTKMKKSGLGRQLIQNHLIDDWEEIKKYGQFAKNRHGGMVQSGYWKTPFKKIRNFSSLTNEN
jgi:hypothetical protein